MEKSKQKLHLILWVHSLEHTFFLIFLTLSYIAFYLAEEYSFPPLVISDF